METNVESNTSLSLNPNLYFDDFLKQFEHIFEAPVSEFKQWEDETLELLLQRSKIEVSDLGMCKLHAYKNFDSSTCYISTPLEFCNMVSILNDEIPITNIMETVDPAYIAWAIEVLEHYDNDNSIQITEEVVGYIQACFYDAGMTKLPSSLKIFELPGSSNDNADSDMERMEKYVLTKAQLAGWKNVEIKK